MIMDLRKSLRPKCHLEKVLIIFMKIKIKLRPNNL
tara:strand:+ start:95 stop:199 length:105 start_codon:yes stop_codon:yes gene_type:complete